jgi:hypothetical protein
VTETKKFYMIDYSRPQPTLSGPMKKHFSSLELTGDRRCLPPPAERAPTSPKLVACNDYNLANRGGSFDVLFERCKKARISPLFPLSAYSPKISPLKALQK